MSMPTTSPSSPGSSQFSIRPLANPHTFRNVAHSPPGKHDEGAHLQRSRVIRKATDAEKQMGLFKYFGGINRDQLHKLNQKQQITAQEDRQHNIEKEAHRKLTMAEKKRAGARVRKQRERDRKKAMKLAAAGEDNVKMSEVQNTADLPPVAEMSRPKRSIMAGVAKDVKGRGAKRKWDDKDRINVNWKHPLIFAMIIEAQKEIKLYSVRWSPQEIVSRCQGKSWLIFGHLLPQTLGRWIDRSKPEPCWSAAVLDEVRLHGNTPRWQRIRLPLLHAHPEVATKIVHELKNLRKTGMSITVPAVRAVVQAYMQLLAPEVNDFKCSDSWIRKFVFREEELRWVMRKPTKAAQKVPKNADELILIAFYRHVLSFRDGPIQHPCFRVNMDQTQFLLQMGGGLTFEILGSRQVPVVGLEEKRAFTLVVAVSSSGELLPFQAIYQGMTNASVPSKNAKGYAEIERRGFLLDYSGTKTYWSNIITMQRWVSKILVPYWNAKKLELNLDDQECLLQLDVWSVHRSREFQDWVRKTYPWIILDFVPGGCTGLFQPCDVGIQRPLKLAARKSQQNDLLQEAKRKLESGDMAEFIVFDKTLGTLRNRSVQWMLDAHDAVNTPEIVLKVRECTIC